MKSQIGVHDAAGRGTHAAGPDRMVMSHDRALYERFKIRVAAAIDAGIDLLRTPFRQRGLMSDHASRIECLPNEPAVMLGGQIPRVDAGRIGDARAGERDPAAAGGMRHAGENLAAVLARRDTNLPAPIQMCDGLSRNIPSEFDTILSQCLAHARRKYVELTETFPAEVRFVLETLREVYITDARARDR